MKFFINAFCFLCIGFCLRNCLELYRILFIENYNDSPEQKIQYFSYLLLLIVAIFGLIILDILCCFI